MAMSEDLFFGELLQRLRKRKKLTQQQLARCIEVTRETVSLWERGNYKPEAEGILYQIVQVLGLTTQEQAQLFEAYTVTALATSFHAPPFKRNPYFTGRVRQLSQLHTLLSAGKQVALTQAISGLGGIGKTQMALEYAYRYQKSYHDIFWASADTEESLIASYVQFAYELHLAEVEEADQTKVKAAVLRWFQEHTNWLLIVDNIEDLRLLPSFVPEDRQGAVLLTTRRQVTEPVAQTLELEVLSEDEAILFLLKRTKVLTLDASLKDASDDEIEAARAITHLLGNLPLALDQAGAYILETQCSFVEYALLLHTHWEQLLQRRIGESIPTDHPDSVMTTFGLNFQQIQQRSDAAADLLRLCAYLAPDAIAEEVLTAGAPLLGSTLSAIAADAFSLNQAIEQLRAFSLVRRDPKEKTLSVHRLVQVVLQNQQGFLERQIWAERAVKAVNAAFPKTEYKTWAQCERLLPLALTVVEHIEQLQMTFEEAGRLLFETASYLQDRARYGEAEPLYQQALHIREQALGPEHPDVAMSLHGLASLYFDQGKYEEAEPLYQRALRIREQALGPEHPDVAMSLNRLASLYFHQDEYHRAEPLYQQALYALEQTLGPEHLFLAHPLNNLGSLYFMQGKYIEAEPLFQRALHIWEPTLGPEHPDIARALNYLANLYFMQGRYVEAEPLFQRALHTWEQALGPEHSLVAHSLLGLANLYLEQRAYKKAKPLFQRALHIWEQALGPENLLIAYPLNNLAFLYFDQKEYRKAELFYQRALRIWEQSLGSEHSDVAYPLNGLATIYREQGKYAEAKSLFQRALSIREQKLGSQHSETAETMHDLALLQDVEGNKDEAKRWYTCALAVREQTIGKHHPKTRETRKLLIALLHALEQHEEAIQLEIVQFEQEKEL